MQSGEIILPKQRLVLGLILIFIAGLFIGLSMR
ncbi:hypothetical protein BMS3Abin16_01141 [archaeon BMS3Abin16]|nr:hypothetical protein BMS3Abin16_01141 [archaeon BMS3Abin16]